MMSHKLKSIGLIIGFVLLLCISYLFAISRTIDQRKQYLILNEQNKNLKSAPKQLTLLKQKTIYYDSILSKFQVNGTSLQNNLLKSINNFAEQNDIKVVTFNEPHVTLQNEIKINTYEVVIEGSYQNMLSLIYQLEQKTKLGEIIHVQFEKKQNFRTNREYLQSRVLIRNKGNGQTL